MVGAVEDEAVLLDLDLRARNDKLQNRIANSELPLHWRIFAMDQPSSRLLRTGASLQRHLVIARMVESCVKRPMSRNKHSALWRRMS